VGPLIYFSDINPINSRNSVTRAEAHLFVTADAQWRDTDGFASEYSLGVVSQAQVYMYIYIHIYIYIYMCVCVCVSIYL